MFYIGYFTHELLAKWAPNPFCRTRCGTENFICNFVPPLGGGMENFMNRIFDDHILRKSYSLDGTWKFCTDASREGETLGYAKGLGESAKNIIVPSIIGRDFGLLEYEGITWFERKFNTNGGTLRFCFGAVMTEAKVWLDGEYLGEHYGGFCEFDFIAEDVAAGEHTLIVRVDNSSDLDSIPHPKVDWYHHGGIIRSVHLEELSGVCVLGCHAEYTLNDSLTAAEVSFKLKIYSKEDAETSLDISVGDNIVAAKNIKVCKGVSEVRTESITLSDIVLWDIHKPNLYKLVVKTATDDFIDRIGFRYIEVKNSKIYLNNKEVEFRGANRHEDHPDWGFAVPAQLSRKDVEIFCDMGANAVRGSHYPQSRAFVDLLDENGLMFWSEIPIWGCGYTAADLARPLVLKRGLDMLKEMVEVYYNHPSIVIWGIHNEIESGAESGLEMTKLYYSETKKIGGNRLVTYASRFPFSDICFEYCDVMSVNYYYGWYEGTIKTWDAFLKKFEARREELGLTDKPLIMSEFGAAAIYGNHTFDNLKWTEEYQAELLSYCIEAFHRSEMVCGMFVWQFCDMLTAKEVGLSRARHYNNKGILNEYRKPKSAYFAIKERYSRWEKE